MQKIDYEQVRNLKDRNAATLINVLPKDAFSKTHIPGAINVPYEDTRFTSQVESVIGSKDAPVIVYCASYDCDASKKAGQKLIDAGFTNVMCYEGGAREWQEKSGQRSAAA